MFSLGFIQVQSRNGKDLDFSKFGKFEKKLPRVFVMALLSDVFDLFMSKTEPADGADLLVRYSFLIAAQNLLREFFLLGLYGNYFCSCNTILLIFVEPINFLV